eukprot:COSAG03_NODE_23035_length_284_cov_0.556757_1_plen_71_part_01
MPECRLNAAWSYVAQGDLIAALFLAWYHREPEAPPYVAAERVVATVVSSGPELFSLSLSVCVCVRACVRVC